MSIKGSTWGNVQLSLDKIGAVDDFKSKQVSVMQVEL
jgi:hypothetical protein